MVLRKLLLPTLSAATFLVASPQVVVAAEGASDDIAEVVVTARKREETLLEVPIAVSAISAEEISNRGIFSITDVVNNTPGLNLNSVNSGRNDRSFQMITLRGFTPASTNSTLTATFIDGVPVASATAFNSVTNPERIEILRGPQAAYFGRNTFAGAINVVNRLPGHEFGGEVSASAGTRDTSDLSFSLEGPLFNDMLGFRVTGRTYAKNGSYINAANPSETLGDQSTKVATMMLVAKPTDQLTIKLFGLMSRNEDGPSAQGQLSAWEIRNNGGVVNVPGISGNSAGTIVLPNVSNCTISGLALGRSASEARVSRPYFCGAVPGLPAGFSPAQNTLVDAPLQRVLANGAFRNVSVSQGVSGYGLKSTHRHGHLNVDWDIGDSGFTLSSLTGVNAERYSELADLDNWDNSMFRNPFPAGLNSQRSYWDFPFLIERENYDFSQEVRLAYDNKGPFHGVVGAAHLHLKQWFDGVNVFSETELGLNRATNSTGAPREVKTNSAFFGLTYDFNDRLSASAEGRYQQDEVFLYNGPAAITISQANATALGVPAAGGAHAAFEKLLSAKYNNFLPRLIVQYDLTDDVMGYVSYSKAVNVGIDFFNQTPFSAASATVLQAFNDLGLTVVVEPEKITNYELGLKGKFLDNRLQGTLALYRANWTDQINRRTVTLQDAPPPAGTGAPQIVSGQANSGEVVAQGIEFDVLAKLASFDLTVSAAMNDSDIRRFSDPSISQATGLFGDGFKGNQLPLSSKYSANIALQYNGKAPKWQDGTWFARADVNYKDKQFADAGNLTWIKARTQVNLRAGLRTGAFGIDAYVTNAFNDKNYLSIAQNTLLVPGPAPVGTTTIAGGSFAYVNLAVPDLRTYGLKVTYKF